MPLAARGGETPAGRRLLVSRCPPGERRTQLSRCSTSAPRDLALAAFADPLVVKTLLARRQPQRSDDGAGALAPLVRSGSGRFKGLDISNVNRFKIVTPQELLTLLVAKRPAPEQADSQHG